MKRTCAFKQHQFALTFCFISKKLGHFRHISVQKKLGSFYNGGVQKLVPFCTTHVRVFPSLPPVVIFYSFLLLRFFLGLFRAFFWDCFFCGFSNSRDCRMFIALSWPSDIFTASKVKTSSENAAIGKFEISSDNSF